MDPTSQPLVPSSLPTRLLHSTGLHTVLHSTRDVKLILLQRFIRVFAFGLVALLLASYLSSLGISETQIGTFFALTLLGDLLIVLILTQIADTIGRKTVLLIGATSMTFSGVVFAVTKSYWVLLAAAVVGVVSPSATEVGPFKTIEESVLFTLVETNLVDVLSWYGTAEFAAAASGLVVSGFVMDYLQSGRGWEFVEACRFVFVVYAAVGAVKIMLTCCLSERIEAQGWKGGERSRSGTPERESGSDREDTGVESQFDAPSTTLSDPERMPLLQPAVLTSPEDFTTTTTAQRESRLARASKKLASGLLSTVFALDAPSRLLLLKLCILMATDSCAVGMSSVPWQTYYVRTTFHPADSTLGLIFFTANTLGALGTLTSTSLARRFGNLVTLALTLTPAALVLSLFGLPSHLPLQLVVVFVESFLSTIYLAPRNVFVGRVIDKRKRTAVLGVINMIKIISNASGSFLTGVSADRDLFWGAFVLAGVLKLIYVAAFLGIFLGVDRSMEREAREGGEREEGS